MLMKIISLLSRNCNLSNIFVKPSLITVPIVLVLCMLILQLHRSRQMVKFKDLELSFCETNGQTVHFLNPMLLDHVFARSDLRRIYWSSLYGSFWATGFFNSIMYYCSQNKFGFDLGIRIFLIILVVEYFILRIWCFIFNQKLHWY